MKYMSGSNKTDHQGYKKCTDFLDHMRFNHFECGTKYLCQQYSGSYPLDPDNYNREFYEIGSTALGNRSRGVGLCGFSETACAGGWDAFTVEYCPSTGSCETPEDVEKESRQCEEPGSKECQDIEEEVGESSCPAGNPIDIGSGNKYQEETDFVDSLGHLSFSRNFNSQLSTVQIGRASCSERV